MESDGLLQSVEEWTGIGGKPISGLNPSGEIRKLSGSEIVSMNVYGFSNKIFNFLEMELVEISGKVESGRPFLRILSSYCCRFEYQGGI